MPDEESVRQRLLDWINRQYAKGNVVCVRLDVGKVVVCAVRPDLAEIAQQHGFNALTEAFAKQFVVHAAIEGTDVTIKTVLDHVRPAEPKMLDPPGSHE